MQLDADDTARRTDLAIVQRYSCARAARGAGNRAIDAALATLQSGLRQPVVAWTPRRRRPNRPLLDSGYS